MTKFSGKNRQCLKHEKKPKKNKNSKKAKKKKNKNCAILSELKYVRPYGNTKQLSEKFR